MKDLMVGVGCFVMAFAVFLVAVRYLDLPVVYSDNLTNECVKVVYANGKEGDCNNLPEKYHHEYVVRVGK
jgi:hypothetical protein